MGATYHCEACGEKVQGYDVDLGGVTEVRCLSCGLPLEKRARAAPERFRRVLVADDSPFFTQGLEAFLTSRRLAGEILVARDGAEAIERATAALRERRGVSLAILDLLMPRLSGMHTAVALRAVERGFGAARCAVVFLSSRRIDESFRPLLSELKPAYYVNKSAGEDGLLGERFEAILRKVAAVGPREDQRTD
ncbi:MAG: response regulator [Deltaproteobacteria bacterium]|nr:response regulator [Deltaproteobacteria bacterium]